MERTVGLMPRRNRNAHAPRIDADELAAQADQLTAELVATNPMTVFVPGETQLCYQLGALTSTGKTNLFRDYIASFIHDHPGCQLHLIDAKAVTRYAS
jgi:hypothetical protein